MKVTGHKPAAFSGETSEQEVLSVLTKYVWTLPAQSGGEVRVPDSNTKTTARPEAEGAEAWRPPTSTQRTQTRYTHTWCIQLSV